MKRSPEIVPLSHDHHQALYVAQRLRRAEDGDESAVAKQLLTWWEETGSRHFEIEEQVLLPLWFQHDPQADETLAARLLADHLQLRSKLRRIAAGDRDLPLLNGIGEAIVAHVRFEERELFSLIEGRLSADAIAALGAEIAAAEARRSG